MEQIKRDRATGLWMLLIGFMLGFLVGGFYIHVVGI